LRLELGQYIDGIDFGIDEVAEHEIDQTVLASKRNGRLGPVHSEGVETTAFAACHDHAEYIHKSCLRCPMLSGEWV